MTTPGTDPVAYQKQRVREAENDFRHAGRVMLTAQKALTAAADVLAVELDLLTVVEAQALTPSA